MLKKENMIPNDTFHFATIVAWEREKGTPPFKVVRQEGVGELPVTTPLNLFVTFLKVKIPFSKALEQGSSKSVLS